MDKLIIKVIKERLGREAIEIVQYVHARVNKVYSIKTEDLDLVIRIAPKRHDKYPNKFNVESYVFSLCRKKGLPTPEVILIDKSCEILDTPYTISKKLFGNIIEYEYLTQDKKRKALQNAGHSLSIIHSIETNGFGPLDSNNMGKWNNWSEIIEDKLISLEKIHRYGILDSNLKKKIIEAIYKNYHLAKCSKPYLLHGDYNLTNLLIDNDQNITGILDMEHCYSGDPIYDLALFDYYYHNKNFLKLLLEGYSNIGLERLREKVLFYNTIISMGKLVWKYETGQFLDTIKPSLSLLEKNISQLFHKN